MKRLALLLTAAAALGACQKSPTAGPGTSAELAPVDLSNHPPMTQLPDPELNGGHAGRAPRRITVDQLSESIVIAAGRPWSQLPNRAASMGKADFAVTVSENTEPNLVFAKFLEDGAREVCLATARDDLAKTEAAQRVLYPELPAGALRDFTTVDDAALDKNLVYLSTRFWGQPLTAPELTEWSTTFKTVAARAKQVNRPEQAWATICIAMMTDPRFITY